LSRVSQCEVSSLKSQTWGRKTWGKWGPIYTHFSPHLSHTTPGIA
jgi:hypothetical protein